jgi:hypothetical protein
VLARLAGTLPKPLITACPEGPSVLLLNLSSETRKPPSSKHRHLAHKQHSATPPDQQSFCCCCCCCSSSAFRISLSDRRTTPSARPTTPGDLVSAVYLPIYHCPRRPRAGCKETLDGPSPPRRPLLRALHSPPSLLLPVVRAHLPTTCMSSPPVAYTPSTPHIRLNSGSDDLVNMADNQNAWHRWLCFRPPLATSRPLIQQHVQCWRPRVGRAPPPAQPLSSVTAIPRRRLAHEVAQPKWLQLPSHELGFRVYWQQGQPCRSFRLPLR